jgi:Cytochrome c oxidase subunit VIc.
MAPQLRNLLQRKVFSTIATGFGLGLAAALTWKFAYADPKKAKYAEFYKNYDADAAAKELEARLAAAGK